MSPYVPQPFGAPSPEIAEMRRLTRRLDRTLLAFAAVVLFVAIWAAYLCFTLRAGAVR